MQIHGHQTGHGVRHLRAVTYPVVQTSELQAQHFCLARSHGVVKAQTLQVAAVTAVARVSGDDVEEWALLGTAAGETLGGRSSRFDDAELTVSRAGDPINLTEREYRLARCLFANLGRPLSREYLYQRFWTHEEMVSSRPLDTHIYRLRNKLGLTADRGWQLLTIYGYGYRLESVGTGNE